MNRQLQIVLAALPLLSACPRQQEITAADQQAAPATERAHRPDSAPAGPALKVTRISFAGPGGHRLDSTFARGETVNCLFSVLNHTYKDGQADIVASVQLRNEQGALMLRGDPLEMLKGKAPTRKPGMIRGAASFSLHPALPPGEYKVWITVEDRLGSRQGSGSARLILAGPNTSKSPGLTLRQLQSVAETALPAGAALPLQLQLGGFKSLATPQGHSVHLSIETQLERTSGEVIRKQEETLLKRQLPFIAESYPLEYITLLPRDLTPGPYRLSLMVRDRIGKGTTRGIFNFRVIPTSLQIVNLHLHDVAGLPRDTFRLGEQAFVRLEVHGLRQRKGELKAELDLAISGPQGGVHFARKNATTTKGEASRAAATAGRFPAQLPLVLPTLSPAGKYKLVVRARDLFARRTVTKELTFQLAGETPKPLGTFTIDQLLSQERPDLPPVKGDTFVAGKRSYLTLRAAAKGKQIKKLTFRFKIAADLKLRNLRGELLHEQKDLFKLDRTLNYRPIRLPLTAEWTCPGLPPGLYDLEIVARNLLDDHVSQMTRRVEIR